MKQNKGLKRGKLWIFRVSRNSCFYWENKDFQVGEEDLFCLWGLVTSVTWKEGNAKQYLIRVRSGLILSLVNRYLDFIFPSNLHLFKMCIDSMICDSSCIIRKLYFFSILKFVERLYDDNTKPAGRGWSIS